jgi:hypothetical protein
VCVLSTLLVVGGCGGDDGSTGATSTSADLATAVTDAPDTTSLVTTVTAATDVRAIPDGIFSRVVARDAALADGRDPALVDELLGADGELPLSIKFQGDRYTVFDTADDGSTGPGDIGTQYIDADGRRVQTSESEGCPGCVSIIDWTLAGDTLTLSCAPVDKTDCVGDTALVIEGDWVRS